MYYRIERRVLSGYRDAWSCSLNAGDFKIKTKEVYTDSQRFNFIGHMVRVQSRRSLTRAAVVSWALTFSALRRSCDTVEVSGKENHVRQATSRFNLAMQPCVSMCGQYVGTLQYLDLKNIFRPRTHAFLFRDAPRRCID